MAMPKGLRIQSQLICHTATQTVCGAVQARVALARYVISR